MSLFAYMLSSYLQNQTRHYFSADHLYVDLSPMVANASNSAQTPEHGRIPGTFDEQGQFIFARVDFQGEVPTAAVSSFVAPAAPAAMEPGRFRFQDVLVTAPDGWSNDTSTPNEQMIWKFRSGTINLQATRLKPGDYAGGPETQLSDHPKNFINGVKEAGRQFRKAKAGLKTTSRIGGMYVSSVDVELKILYMRQDMIIDYDGGFVYLITRLRNTQGEGTHWWCRTGGSWFACPNWYLIVHADFRSYLIRPTPAPAGVGRSPRRTIVTRPQIPVRFPPFHWCDSRESRYPSRVD